MVKYIYTPESQINVGQIINIGPKKVAKNNKCMALNEKCKVMLKKTDIKLLNIFRAFDKVIESGKKSKINERRAHIDSGLYLLPFCNFELFQDLLRDFSSKLQNSTRVMS